MSAGVGGTIAAVKLPRARHRWNLDTRQAIRLQQRLAAEVLQAPLANRARYVAGGDATITADGARMVAGWVVWDLRDELVVEEALAVRPVRFPYVPGLLSFREAPSLIAAARRLKSDPDVFMFDGQGLAHPRRLGLACHVGLLLDRPSLGCAKSRLCGSHAMPADRIGASSRLMYDGECVGRVVRTRRGVKPVFVSVGHRITLDDAVWLTLRCCTRYRLPEPTRLAHQFVGRHREP
ncbi:MAG: deoxyribonuclease V [Planctomycetota bacterium]